MARHQLYPLEQNPRTGEPFLRLPSPYEHIILTPLRTTDAGAAVNIINDPSVAPWLALSEIKLTRDECHEWLLRTTRVCDDVLRELNAAEGESELRVVDGCPLRCLREVKSDGTEVYIGDIMIKRCSWIGLADEDEKEKLIRENEERIRGDPKIVWQIAGRVIYASNPQSRADIPTITDFLAPSHHRKGIMTAALARLLQKWAVPRMGVRHIRVSVYEGNDGSLGVFRKVGFKVVETIKDACDYNGGKRSVVILEWKLEEVLLR